MGSDGNSVVVSLTKKFNKKVEAYDKEFQRRMNTATNIVWRTAHAKRPLITKTEMKASGRSKRVSDPNASFGVPVDTGKLQASVKQKVVRTFGLMSFEGQVSAGGNGIPYATTMEYGDPMRGIAPRPFMTPAVNLNKDAIKRTYGATVSSNL